MEDASATPFSTAWESRKMTTISVDPLLLSNPSASYILPVSSTKPKSPPRRLTSVEPTVSPTKSTNVPEKTNESSWKKFCNEHVSITRIMGFLIGLIITAVPLAVLVTLYIQLLTTTTTSASNSGSTTTSYNLPTQCSSTVYTTLNDATRSISYSASCCTSDCGFTGWYRFTGSGGTRLATSPVSIGFCSANYPGWFNGTLPTVVGATSSGAGCVNYVGTVCHPSYSSNLILATNCGNFYVFYLTAMTSCSWSRHCTTF